MIKWKILKKIYSIKHVPSALIYLLPFLGKHGNHQVECSKILYPDKIFMHIFYQAKYLEYKSYKYEYVLLLLIH